MSEKRAKVTFSTSQSWRVMAWSMVGVLLVLPAIAMRFTDEVNWSLGDFIFAAVLLISTGLAIEVGLRLSRTGLYRSGVTVAAVTALLLVWINGAVGIIGNEDNPANLAYLGVLGSALAGTLLAKFQARGMARALFTTACAHAAVMIAAPVLEWGPPGEPAIRTACVNAVFVMLWCLAAGLFWRADRKSTGGLPGSERPGRAD
ncbi:hypothetical protein F3N42_01080 [Marinihelvus fidelis]|uniref:Uncharacterized protein n=1 Tax=Marinihelvus fidelis TaxID=2613842 RepID=A0A5N0TJR9_9GAMM|nr:hypothetical protein [Marinihelvus fidelis]KAA9134166.1 hypothetical protein F3N42_01080 [Marinihelvus fidelis]